MKYCQVTLLLALVVLASSPAMATKCPPEYTCTKYINQGPCDAAKCMMDCVSSYKGAGEGQCFPQGCMCSYCCKPHQRRTI
ncbi:hypothetical protein CFC21_089526 [Triticum aestivum]|uniref:Defensin n=3 Tax=Triticum TaxID=4564 RepID=A0A9R0YUK0_TRITD|nr:hypothetical protein CFC21_089526 [Triticum aestivum]VAI61547.1 unnamed protein product [Triticum turgidum subsp. durum]